MMKTYLIPAGVAGFLCLAVLGYSKRPAPTNPPAPVPYTGKQNPESGFAQAIKLMAQYQAANGDWSLTDTSLLNHPDQAQHGSAGLRFMPAFIPTREEIYKGQVAFFSFTYVKKNLKREGGDVVTSNPTGFYIVGYVNGDVEKVPANQVRHAYRVETWSSGKQEVWKLVFPGMREYAWADLLPGKRPVNVSALK